MGDVEQLLNQSYRGSRCLQNGFTILQRVQDLSETQSQGTLTSFCAAPAARIHTPVIPRKAAWAEAEGLRTQQCGEEQPLCKRCTRAGLQCEGYPKPALRFQILLPPGSNPPSPPRDGRTTNHQDEYDSEEARSRLSGQSEAPLHNPISVPTEQKARELLHCAVLIDTRSNWPTSNDPSLASPVWPRWPIPYRSWLAYIPSRLGYSRSLDAASELLVVATRACRCSDPSTQSVQEICRTPYVQALRSLQEAITTPEEALSAEVLCATMLLGLYEVSSVPVLFDVFLKKVFELLILLLITVDGQQG